MYTILQAVDSNQDSARLAAEAIAEFPDDEEMTVVVLNVQKAFETADEGARISSEDFYDESSFPKSVDVAMEIFDSAGISATKRREHGDPAETILEVAAELPADHVVIGNRKRSPAGKALFGSVTQSVILNADLPVTVVSHG